jgi:hypothetical protein
VPLRRPDLQHRRPHPHPQAPGLVGHPARHLLPPGARGGPARALRAVLHPLPHHRLQPGGRQRRVRRRGGRGRLDLPHAAPGTPSPACRSSSPTWGR